MRYRAVASHPMAQQPLVRLRLLKAGGEIGTEITVAALADLQGKPGETWGYDPNAFVYALVAPNKKDPPYWVRKDKKKLKLDSTNTLNEFIKKI